MPKQCIMGFKFLFTIIFIIVIYFIIFSLGTDPASTRPRSPPHTTNSYSLPCRFLLTINIIQPPFHSLNTAFPLHTTLSQTAY